MVHVRGVTPIVNVASLELSWPPIDRPWGVREFNPRHRDGHTFRIASGLPESA